ncbi:methionine adenosyltransferase [Actinocorallia aurea]
MKILMRTGLADPDQLRFDCAERKGIGHPDTLADLIADTFSREYSAWCLNAFGAIPNHWVDKVTLIGAASEVAFGSFRVAKPVECHLVGKLTARIGNLAIPVDEIFAQVVRRVMDDALGSPEIWPHLVTRTYNTSGVAVDHDGQFYAPSTPSALRRVLAAESVSNDTVLCTGTSGPGLAGRLAIQIEEEIRAFAPPQIGTDVKVMVVRDGSGFEATAAIPVHPESVTSWRQYSDLIRDVAGELADRLRPSWDVTLRVNTKDIPGRGYLAPFGTSLGKGDCGAVGRGNRGYGVIEPLRASSGDAPAGKNPVHHGGKIFGALAATAAQAIREKTGRPAEVTVAARNGEPLDDPAFVLVSLTDDGDRGVAEEIVRQTVADSRSFTERFLATDPIARHRRGDG